MAAIDEIPLESSVVQEMVHPQDIKDWVRKAFWIWFDANQNDEIIEIGFLFIHKTVRLRDLQPAFERFFGTRETPA